MRCSLLIVLALCACGRFNFDPRNDATGGPGVDGITIGRCGYTNVAASKNHTCAVDQDGIVWCWGGNRVRQVSLTDAPYFLSPQRLTLPAKAATLTGGRDFSCARLENDDVWCWGETDYGQLGGGIGGPTTPRKVDLGGDRAAELSGGTFHACVRRKSDGAVECWGDNTRLAIGQAAESIYLPTLLPITAGAIDLGIGHKHGCVVIDDGRTICWGRNESFQLGNSDQSTSSRLPEVESSLPPLKRIAAGGRFTCGIDLANSLHCWGKNAEGQLGRGMTGGDFFDAGPSILDDVADVQLSTAGACALKLDGTVWCWGDLSPGDGTLDRPTTPRSIGLSNIAFVSMGYYHACAISRLGQLTCWGGNNLGALGRGTRTVVTAPQIVTSLTAVSNVTTDGFHACAVAGGTVYCWGVGAEAELGNGTRNGSRTPIAITTGLAGVNGIASGPWHTCAWGGNQMRCWGLNDKGQCAAAMNGMFSTNPVSPGLTAVTDAAVGWYHTCAIDGGAVKCWGANGAGQLGDGTTNDSPTPVGPVLTTPTKLAAGWYHTCVIDNGGVKCWGANYFGQLGNGMSGTGADLSSPFTVPGLTNVVSIAAGAGHTCAVESGGDLYCWGRNEIGELGLGDQTSRSTPSLVTGGVVAVSAAAGGTCALFSDTSVSCWGAGEFGQLASANIAASSPTPVPELLGASGIARGQWGGCAIIGGALSCWGVKDVLGDGDTSDLTPMPPVATCVE